MKRKVRESNKLLAPCRDAEGYVDTDGECYKRVTAKPEPAPRAAKPAIPAKPKAARPTPVAIPAAKALHGAAGIVKAAVGVGAVDAGTLADRKAACESCPHLKPLRAKMMGVTVPVTYKGCELCGCAWSKKLKVASESCPIGKWRAVPKNPEAAESCPDTPPKWGPVK